MVRLPCSGDRPTVFTAFQGDCIAPHLPSSVRFMLIAATLLLIFNTATAADPDPTCTSDVVAKCYLPQKENGSIVFRSYFSGYDADVGINRDNVNITLKPNQEGSPITWPTLKLLLPENFIMTVSVDIPNSKGKEYTFSYQTADVLWKIYRHDGDEPTYKLNVTCKESEPVITYLSDNNSQRDFEFFINGSMKFFNPPGFIDICSPVERSGIDKTVVTLRPTPTKIKVPTGSSVTLKLTNAMIMLDSRLRPTTVAPTTTSDPNATTPYNGSSTTTTSTGTPEGAAVWLIAVIVVISVLALVALIGLAVFFVVIRPRMQAKKGAMEQSSGYAESSAKQAKKHGKRNKKQSKKDADGSKKRKKKEGKLEQENTPSLKSRPEDAQPPNAFPEPPTDEPITPRAPANAPGVEPAYENLGPMPPPQPMAENMQS